MSEVQPQYSINDAVRCYDFPGINRKAYYLEGTIMRVDPEEYPGCIEVLCTFDSMAIEECSRIGEIIYTPMVTDLDQLWEHERIVVLEKNQNT